MPARPSTPCRSRPPFPVLLLALGPLVAGCGDVPAPTAPVHLSEDGLVSVRHEPLGFMTRNVYVGADLAPVIEAAATGNPLALIAAAGVAWQQVQASRIPDRADALAHEIVRSRPRLVGLQEAFLFVELDGSFQPTGLTLDMLGSIEAELAAMGAHYSTVAVQENTSSTIPVAFDPGTGQVTRWVAFTDRIAVLARQDVSLDGVAQAAYAARVPIAEGFDLTRGWIRVTTRFDGVPHHFVNTHLEVQALTPVQAAQALELRGSVLAGLEGVTVLVGDLNSDAETGPGSPSWTPTYGELIGDGFTDLWEVGGSDRITGYTCCQAPDLRNRASELGQRIDFVLVRSTEDLDLDRPGRVRLDILGDGIGDRTPGLDPLWPSDHAGLVAKVALRSGLVAMR